MIKKIEQIIINKLIGQVEIWESELGVTFEPIVIPIIVNPKFLRNGGIENFKPKIALIEQTIVGPNINGAGIFKNHAKKAPKDPRVRANQRAEVPCIAPGAIAPQDHEGKTHTAVRRPRGATPQPSGVAVADPPSASRAECRANQ